MNEMRINRSYGTQRVLARKEDNVLTLLQIPAQKPDMYKLYDVQTMYQITEVQVIEQWGDRCIGDKVLVKGYLETIMLYAANVPTRSVHAAEYTIPVSTVVILKEKAPENILAKFIIEETEGIFLDERTFKVSTVWEVVLTD